MTHWAEDGFKFVDFFTAVHNSFMLYNDNILTLKMWFFWLTLKKRKIWTATVGHQYLHLGVKLASCSFLKSFICISSWNVLVFRELDFQSRGPRFKTAGWLRGWLSTTPGNSVVKSKLSLFFFFFLLLLIRYCWGSGTPSTKMGHKAFSLKIIIQHQNMWKMRLLYH